MHDEIFFKECFECERQFSYEIKEVKDNYFKCRLKKRVIQKIYEGIVKCPYFKRRENDG